MGDVLQGFLPIVAVGSALGFALFVWHFTRAQFRRNKFDAGDTGALEGNDRLPPLCRRPSDDDHLWEDVDVGK